MEQGIKTIIVNGTELHFIERGEGTPVIFVHGSVGDYRTWGFQVEPFSRDFHVYSYSRRYHYPNKWNGDGLDYSVALHADDLAAFIGQSRLAPVNLVGNSYGAYVCLYLTCKHPELVNSLVLGEPPILIWLEHINGGEILMREFFEQAFQPAKEAFAEDKMEDGVRLFIDGVLGKNIYSNLPQRIKDLMLDNASEMKAETTSPVYFSNITFEEVKKVQCPVLLLTGQRSPKFFHLIVDKLQECLPMSERTEVPDASHSMQTGNPEFFNKVVSGFLQKVIHKHPKLFRAPDIN